MVHVAREMQRREFNLPLLIGGATTSAKHTAVKIAPAYQHETIHVADASRAAGIVEQLLNPDSREPSSTAAIARNKAIWSTRIVSGRTVNLFPMPTRSPSGFRPIGRRCGSTCRRFSAAACWTIFRWRRSPNTSTGRRFFMAWEMKGKYPQILADPVSGEAAQRLFDDARRCWTGSSARSCCTARGVYGFWPADVDGDDIALYADESRRPNSRGFTRCGSNGSAKGKRPFMRWPISSPRCDSGRADYLGGFAVTTGIGCDALVRDFEADHDDYQAIMTKALADRLAEAFAEMLHISKPAPTGATAATSNSRTTT